MSQNHNPIEPWFIDQLRELDQVYGWKLSGINGAFAGEGEHVACLLKKLDISNGYVVDVAASNGVAQSCTLQFFEQPGWHGLAVEMDPSKFAILAFIYSSFKNARLARCRATPDNVCALLNGNEVPLDFDLLNLDIDSYDLYVLKGMLEGGFRPKVVTMEINEKVPPPIYFTVTYEENHFWKGDHFYGCSIVAASELMKQYGYHLESVQYNNALFVRGDLAIGYHIADLSAEQAYRAGYADRPERASMFPWNANVDEALTAPAEQGIEVLKQFFGQYKNYILFIAP